jgi:hypothetical protein
MSVSIPSSFDFGVDLGVDLDISGIPTNYSVNANVAPMSMSLAPMTLNLGPIDIRPSTFLCASRKSPPSARTCRWTTASGSPCWGRNCCACACAVRGR